MDVAKPDDSASDDCWLSLSPFTDGQYETAPHVAVFTACFTRRPLDDPDHCFLDPHLQQRSKENVEPRDQKKGSNDRVFQYQKLSIDTRFKTRQHARTRS